MEKSNGGRAFFKGGKSKFLDWGVRRTEPLDAYTPLRQLINARQAPPGYKIP